jgi:uncharacterized OsmC-like protein
MDDQATLLQAQVAVKAEQKKRMIGRVREHTVVMDIPEERGGDNSAPTPAEYMLQALGGCVLNLTRIIAADNGLDGEGLSVAVCGGIDIARAMGLPSRKRAGFMGIEVTVKAPRQRTAGQIDHVFEQLTTRCPLCDTIGNPTVLKVSLV